MLKADEYLKFVVQICMLFLGPEAYLSDDCNIGGVDRLWWAKEVDILIYNFFKNIEYCPNREELTQYMKWNQDILQP